MAQSDLSLKETTPAPEHGNSTPSFWRRVLGRTNGAPKSPETSTTEHSSQSDEGPKPGLMRRASRKVVPGLPRVQTFKRQQSELRDNLEPVQPTPAERRALSVDRRQPSLQDVSQTRSNPRSSAPDFGHTRYIDDAVTPPVEPVPFIPLLPVSPLEEKQEMFNESIAQLDIPSPDTAQSGNGLNDVVTESEFNGDPVPDTASIADYQSMTSSRYEAALYDELEHTWILNLSMHFRDKSKREKFFVTYRQQATLWRRVTVSVDYRDAPEDSLEMELANVKFQRDKIAKIYDAIRQSLPDIKFYETVTNLKLQTTDGRLHVHVVEDTNEIIHYPTVRMIQHMRCPRVKERDIEFDSHMSGFVYKVRVSGKVLIKKEIPGPDTVDEFLYEINALNRLRHAHHVIQFHGVIVDDDDEYVKGLLISYADQGALIDVIYDQAHHLPWPARERWARQIISGLAEIHEAGFVQGDFTLSNIVIDEFDNAKIIDINRRGCPVGWEPPEATPLIESGQRISMYIGVKSDLFQLGMVLWAIATKEDEPERHGRPLHIGADAVDVPDWYRAVVDICLSEDPRNRVQALQLLSYFPELDAEVEAANDHPSLSISVDDGVTRKEYFVAHPADGYPQVKTVHPPSDWSYVGWRPSHLHSPSLKEDPYLYPTRGRSPPSPIPTPDKFNSPMYEQPTTAWTSTAPPSEGDEPGRPDMMPAVRDMVGPQTSRDSISAINGVEGVGPGVGTPPAGELVEGDALGSRAAGATFDDDTTLTTPLLDEQSEPAEVSTESNQESNEKDHEKVKTESTHTNLSDMSQTGSTDSGLEDNGSKEHVCTYLRAHRLPEMEHDLGSTATRPTGPKCDSDTAEGAAAIPLPPSEPSSEHTEHARELTPSNETTVIFRSPSSSRHSGSSSTLRDLPDDLRGVGSTYDLLDEKRLGSIMDDDLTVDMTDVHMGALQ